MTKITDMTDAQLREHFRAACLLLASEHYKHHTPGATDETAARYAERNWRQFKERALDFLALAEADRQARAAAPNN